VRAKGKRKLKKKKHKGVITNNILSGEERPITRSRCWVAQHRLEAFATTKRNKFACHGMYNTFYRVHVSKPRPHYAPSVSGIQLSKDRRARQPRTLSHQHGAIPCLFSCISGYHAISCSHACCRPPRRSICSIRTARLALPLLNLSPSALLHNHPI
jgi:hypothetical protein